MKDYFQFIQETEDRTRKQRDARMYGTGKSRNELTPYQLKNRKKKVKRTIARNKAIKDGKVSKGSTKDIDHKNGNALQNGKNNLRVVSRNFNRSRNNNKRVKKR